VTLGTGHHLRVVQLTDLHLGHGTPQRTLERAVSAASAARPDLVVLTGDYLNLSLTQLPRLRQLGARLPRPCVAVLGNHDHWSGAEAIQRTLAEEGVIVLRNQSVKLKLRGGELTVVGVDDGGTHHDDVARAFAGVKDRGRALVLTHHPKTAEAIMAWGGRLVLSGHTHGGQVAVPRVTAALARAGGHRYLRGWYSVGQGRLYVSPGIGASLIRTRLGRGAWPEVAVFDLL